MRVTETQLEGGGYEQRYTRGLGGKAMFHFVRRPVSILPAEGTICHADNGPRFGMIERMAVAHFKDGKFVGPKFDVTHWTDMESPDGEKE